MREHQSAPSAAQWIARLQQTPHITEHGPFAGRFLHALRLIALHERMGRDPVPELAVRLKRVTRPVASLPPPTGLICSIKSSCCSP